MSPPVSAVGLRGHRVAAVPLGPAHLARLSDRSAGRHLDGRGRAVVTAPVLLSTRAEGVRIGQGRWGPRDLLRPWRRGVLRSRAVRRARSRDRYLLARIAQNGALVLEAVSGSATPSIQTRVRRPSPRLPPVMHSRAKMRSSVRTCQNPRPLCATPLPTTWPARAGTGRPGRGDTSPQWHQPAVL